MSVPPTTSPLPAPAEWAALQGRRLHAIWAEYSQASAEVRAAKLEELFRLAVQEVPGDQREAYVNAVADQFPSWKRATEKIFAPKETADGQQTPEQVVDTLLEMLPSLAAAERELVKQRLTAAGLVAVTVKPLEGEALADIQAKLKMQSSDTIDPQRLGKLFATFADVMLALDQLVWNVWRGAAPKSPIRRDAAQGDLRSLVRRSLTGDAEASAALVQQQLESTRQLIAGLLAGLGPAGQDFAKKFQQRYSPDAIKAAVLSDGGGGLFTNAEAKCWKKYSELGIELTDTSIENEVRDAVVKYAEDLIRGRRG